MTFREKWEKEHPDVDAGFTVHNTCPCDHKYETEPEYCPVPGDCGACWEREIDEVKRKADEVV